MARYATIMFVIILFANKAKAQESGGNTIFDERRFLFEVKQIDEFFERFNNDKNSFIRRNIGKYYKGIKIDRPGLLRTLFDNGSKRIVAANKNQFIETVTNQHHPTYIEFYEPGWWAEATCLFTYNGKPVSAKVLLKVMTDSSRGSKWVISNVQCSQLKKYAGKVSLPAAADPTKFLSPMSHATNFQGLSRAFDDSRFIRSYISDEMISDNASNSFLYALIKKQLGFQQVSSVQYYFMQVSGWKFIVASCIKNKSVNTGWLVTDIQRISDN